MTESKVRPPSSPDKVSLAGPFLHETADFVMEAVNAVQDWMWVDEGSEGRHKWGFVTTVVGAELTLKAISSCCCLLACSTFERWVLPVFLLSLDCVWACGLQQINSNTSKDLANAVMVGIGILRSYDRMGIARLECISGCHCKPKLLDGHHKQHTSQIEWLYHGGTHPCSFMDHCIAKNLVLLCRRRSPCATEASLLIAVSQSNACMVRIVNTKETRSREHKFKVTSFLISNLDKTNVEHFAYVDDQLQKDSKHARSQR